MSMMYCTRCDRPVDTDFMDHCQWGEEFICENCVDNYDPTPDEQGEPPVTWLENASKVRPR